MVYLNNRQDYYFFFNLCCWKIIYYRRKITQPSHVWTVKTSIVSIKSIIIQKSDVKGCGMAWKLVVVLERGVQIEGEGGRVKDLEEAEVEVGRVLKLWRWKESNDNNRLHRSLLWRSRSGMRRCSYTRWHTVDTVGWARGGSHCRRTGHHTTTCPEGNPSIRNAASVYWPLPGGHPFLGWVQCLSQNPCTLK